MAAFLGMGLGVAVGERRPDLHRWTLPVLTVLAALLSFSEGLHIIYLRFPDLSISLWGGEAWPNARTFVLSLLLVLLIFSLIVAVFFCAGSIVGDLFARTPRLQGYSADLIGSLLGVIVMTFVGGLGTPPPVWFAVGALPFIFFWPRIETFVCYIAIVLLAWHSIGSAQFSPYYRIDLSLLQDLPGHPLELSVNRDYHQFAQDLSNATVNSPKESPQAREALRAFQAAYTLPFQLTPRRDRALVVGAGTGNDVAAALRSGFKSVVSVDIDPLIMQIGKTRHPEHPYDNPRVERVVNDARAYFEQHPDERFDVVCFGLLDSHAMFSAMSSLRLENYVYTVQSVRSAFHMVKPGGVLTISFSTFAGRWLSDRLYSLIWDATGVPPLIIDLPIAKNAQMFVVGNQISLLQVVRHVPFTIDRPSPAITTIRTPTDDWPFLYIRPGTFPLGYVCVIGGLLIVAFAGARKVFGRDLFRRENFDVPLFLMGAAFLLIETRGVVDLSLLFGSTWIVNSAVFAGILLMAMLANGFVIRFEPRRIDVVFGLLFAALLLSYFLPPSALLVLPLGLRGAIGAIVTALPVAFAGVIFSFIFKRSEDAAFSLGSNLLGAVVGGCLEYFSIVVGLRALALVALVLYLGVMLIARRGQLQSFIFVRS